MSTWYLWQAVWAAAQERRCLCLCVHRRVPFLNTGDRRKMLIMLKKKLKTIGAHTESTYLILKVWHEIFYLSFLHESVSPRPPSIPLGPFRIFSKIRGDICELMFITGVNDTAEKLFSGVNDTSEKFIPGVLVTDFQWSPVSLILGINLSLTPVTNYWRWQWHRR